MTGDESPLHERVARLEAENRQLRELLERGGMPVPVNAAGLALPESRRRRRTARFITAALLLLAIGGAVPYAVLSFVPHESVEQVDARNAAVGMSAFEVKIGSFHYRPRGEALLERLHAAKIPARLIATPDNPNRVRIYAGPYRTRDEARLARSTILRQVASTNDLEIIGAFPVPPGPGR